MFLYRQSQMLFLYIEKTQTPVDTKIMIYDNIYHPRRYKASSVSQGAGLLIPRSSVQIRQNPQKQNKNRELKSTWILAT